MKVIPVHICRLLFLLPICCALSSCTTVEQENPLPERDATAGRQDELQDFPLRLAPLAAPDRYRFGAVVSVPLPPGHIDDPGQIQILTADGTALPVTRRTRLHWPRHRDAERGPRIVEVGIAVNAMQLLSSPLLLHISEVSVPDTDIAITNPLPAAAILPPQWNIAAHLFSRSRPLTRSGHWFDDAMWQFSRTAINQVPPTVSAEHRIDFSRPAAWLFDRPGLLFDLYFRSGDITLFTEAEKAGRRYAATITPDGFSAWKPEDLKYVYTRSLLYRWMLFGEEHHEARIRAMASAASTWPVDGRGANFWTERHTNYAIAANVSAWELTGEQRYRERIENWLDGLLAMSRAPLQDGLPANCPAHSMRAHEGADSDQPVCSPWMMALLGQTLDRYYQLSGDRRAADLLVRFNRYLLEGGLYRVPPDDANVKLRDMLLPWYLAAREFGFSDNGPFGDLEHSCDVAGLLARSGYYRSRAGSGDPRQEAALRDLMQSCRFNLEMWHRPGASRHGKAEWRLSPPRKFNWWFTSTQDLTWLLFQGAR